MSLSRSVRSLAFLVAGQKRPRANFHKIFEMSTLGQEIVNKIFVGDLLCVCPLVSRINCSWVSEITCVHGRSNRWNSMGFRR